jgi:flagellar hook-associated protein 3 FlgL
MRVSTNQLFNSGLSGIQRQQTQLLETELQLVRGRKVNSPADDPSAAVRILDLRQTVSTLDQFKRNSDAAETGLTLTEQTLGEIYAVLLGVRDTVIDGISSGNTAEDFHHLAGDVNEKLDHLFDLGNRRDASGDYLFAGSRTRIQPFVRSGGGSYGWQGDQQERSIKVGPFRSMDIFATGFDLFVDVPTGNGTVAAAHDPSNSGGGLLTTASSSGAGYNGDDYEIVFSAPDRFDVTDTTTGTTVLVNQPFVPGDVINFGGISATLEGQPAAGDRFTFSPSGSRNALESVSRFNASLASADGTNETAIFNDLTRGLEDMDRILERVNLLRVEAGNRLSALEELRAANEVFDVAFREQLSGLQDVDFVEAASLLSQQANTLEIAQAAFARIQGLSLFNFI